MLQETSLHQMFIFHRMSREVEKSHQQQQKLYAELGKEMFVEWRDEHAAQVLPGHQVQTVSRSMENMDME